MAETAESITQGIDLTGKDVLVTGVNSGIGTETARVMAMRGAHVLGLARTQDSAAAACAALPSRGTGYACELADPDSIRACAVQIRQAHPDGLDVLIANAGIMALPKLEQVNGIEKQFAVNHLGHFLLVQELMPLLGQHKPCRVVVVSSAAHMQAPKSGIEFDNLSGEQGYSPWRAYGQSKLANVLFANELARRLPAGSTANSLHPGVIKTNLGRNMQGIGPLLLGLVMFPFMRSVEQGAATSCYVASHPELAQSSGEYYANTRLAKMSALGRDQALAERLWQVSESMTAAAA